MELRPYQLDALKAIHKEFKKSNRQYVKMPTGSGKTITFLAYAREHYKRILVIVPSRELLRQVSDTASIKYESFEITRKGAGYSEKPTSEWIMNKDGTFSPSYHIHICIINSIRGSYLDYLTKIDFDLIIIDEAHHTQAKSYSRFIEIYSRIHPKTKFLGVTATPDRTDGKMLDEILYKCTFELNIEEMIHKKYLSDIEGYNIKTNIDITDIDDHNGDFSISQLYKKLCTDNRNNLIVETYKREFLDRKTLIFCINIEHSKEICRLLKKQNIASLHIDGTMKTNKRHEILSQFRDGTIKVLCNCQLLTEGFDEPSIDGIILGRPTRSKSLFTQMIGRGLRINPGKKNCKIVDIVDNHKTLAGFNSLLTECKFPEKPSFKNLKELREYVGEESLKITEFIITRVNLLNDKAIDSIQATDSTIEYLEENKITYFEPLTFEEGSFLVWENELKKRIKHGNNS